jgi:hypothetical protein
MVIAGGAAQRTLGRRAAPDTRDLRYLLASRYPEQTSRPPTGLVRVHRGPPLDQGAEPYGVACALLSSLHAGPRRLSPSRTPHPGVLDTAAKALDTGLMGILEPSVSLRAGCRALRQFELIRAYHWSFDLDEIVNWLGSGRGIVLGLDWYAAMNRPDETGLIRIWGKPEGGHAVFAFGVDPQAEVVLLQNDFGPGWGGWTTRPGRRDFQGCCRLPFEDLRKLLIDNGEAVWPEKW